MGSVAATSRTADEERGPGDPLHRWTRRAAENPWVDRLSRAGLASRGVVYAVLAYLVARVALGALGTAAVDKPASGPGVAQAIVSQDGGHAMLVILAIGLLLYALFSILDAVLHHDDESPAAKKWGDRALSAWGFVVYGSFSGYCFVTGLSFEGGYGTSAADQYQHTQWSSDVLRWPGGVYYLGALGMILLIIAAFLVSRAGRRSFRPRLDREQMSSRMWTVANVLGVVGYLGRAALFGIVGWFILHAAVENDPRQGQGVDGSLRMFADSAAGPYVLWLIAVALFGYALYMFVETRYRHV
jgi:hypothetical protein